MFVCKNWSVKIIRNIYANDINQVVTENVYKKMNIDEFLGKNIRLAFI